MGIISELDELSSKNRAPSNRELFNGKKLKSYRTEFDIDNDDIIMDNFLNSNSKQDSVSTFGQFSTAKKSRRRRKSIYTSRKGSSKHNLDEFDVEHNSL